MSWRKFLLGLTILLLSPVLVLVGLATVAYFSNKTTPFAPLQTRVTPTAVLPWQDAVFTFEFDGSTLEKTEPKPVDMVFLIDVSGSMRDSKTAMAAAAKQMVTTLEITKPGLVRFALMRFDTEANLDVPFAANTDQLISGLQHLPHFTEGNNPDAMFAALAKLETTTRPGVRRIGVFYTDGFLCTDGNTTEQQAAEAARVFRDKGWEFFSVGIPGKDSSGLMVSMTGSASRVFNPATQRDLARNFGFLGQAILDAAGHNALFSTPFDGRHFSVPLDDLPWRSEPNGAITRSLAVLPFGKLVLSHPLNPRSAGLWSVGMEPGRLDYLDGNNQVRTMIAPKRPKILVVTWFALFLALLPALLWCLYMWPRKLPIRELSPIPVLPPKRRPKPMMLPPLPRHPQPRLDLVPTLFVGLGELGRLAMDGAAWELEQADSGYHRMPYRFLHLDLTPGAQPQSLPFQALEKREPISIFGPADLAKAEAYLPEGQVPEYLNWFPNNTYRDRSGGELDLVTEQANGDRVLSRLALFQWLRSPQFLERLQAEMNTLWEMPSVDGARQIMLFADWKDGFGSGCALDFARIFQRLNRERQKGNPKITIPEIHLVLCDSDSEPDHLNRLALATELQSIVLTGAYPHPTTYLPGHPLLDRQDSESPFQAAFSIETFRKEDLAGQCGQLAVVLSERVSRTALLASRRKIDPAFPVTFKSHGIHVIPGLHREGIARNLLLSFLGPDVLLAMEPTPGGGFQALNPSEDRIRTLFEDWVKEEAEGTLFHTCLVASRDQRPAGMIGMFRRRLQDLAPEQAKSELTAIGWELENHFLQVCNQKLQGDLTPEGWCRTWFPHEARAISSFLAEQLQTLAQKVAVTEDPMQNGFAHLAQIAMEVTVVFDHWQQSFINHCRQIEETSSRSSERAKVLKNLTLGTYLQSVGTGHETGLERPLETEDCLRRWLKSKDTLPTLRRHLYFELKKTADGNDIQACLTISLMENASFTDADTAVAHLNEIAYRLTARIPATRVSGALCLQPEKVLKELARGLMQRHERVLEALVSIPAPTGLPSDEAECLEQLAREIADPADHGNQVLVATADHSAIRRIELSRLKRSLAARHFLVQRPEIAAERVRERIERIHAIEIGYLPAKLRLAVANPESFSLFALAYCAGLINKETDAMGRPRWIYQDRSLTFSDEPTLAEAAIHFTGSKLPADLKPTTNDTLFHPLKAWKKEGEGSTTDALTLAAIQWYSQVQEKQS